MPRLHFAQATQIGRTVLPVAALLFFAGCDDMTVPTTTEQAKPAMASAAGQSAGPSYNAAGELLRPTNHREWIFVGAPVTPNELNDGKAAFPEFHNVYIDPRSYAAYKRTGAFPEETMIVKELVSVGAKSMDSGNGYFQGEFVSLEAMVKDKQRFADEPGGWAFFRFGEAPDYNATGARMATANCNACHAGANEDYVFTSTYPVLRATKAAAGK